MRGDYSSNLSPMVSITHVSYWLSSLEIFWIDTYASIYPTGQVLSTCIWLDAASWCSRGQYKDTAILRGRERGYGEITLFEYVYFTGYFSNRNRLNRSGLKSAHKGTTSLNSCTSYNTWTISSIQYLYMDTSGCSWLHHYPGSGFGGPWIWQTRVVYLF